MSISSEEGILETAAPRLGIHGITAPAQEHKRLSCTDASAFRPGLTQPTNFLASRPNSQRGSSTSPYTKQQPLNLVPLARGPRTPLNQAQGATLSLQLTTCRRREQRPAKLSARKVAASTVSEQTALPSTYPKTSPKPRAPAAGNWPRTKRALIRRKSKGEQGTTSSLCARHSAGTCLGASAWLGEKREPQHNLRGPGLGCTATPMVPAETNGRDQGQQASQGTPNH